MTINTLISEEALNKRITEIAHQIKTDYQNKPLVLVCVLKGSFIFTADLIRALFKIGYDQVTVEFMGISSYGNNMESSRNPRITYDLLSDIALKHVLIVEDIVDTGYSLDSLQKILATRGPASLKTLVLLSKPANREIDVALDYVGFEVSGWVEGYGLDSAELYRGRSEVIVKST